MKTMLRTLLAALLVALPLVTAADDGGDTTTGKVWLGGWGANTDGSPDSVAEYAPVDGRPLLGLMVASHQAWGSLSLDAFTRDTHDSEGVLEFDLGRAVRSHTSYSTLLHRLGHDPMENLEATSTNGKVVIHRDLNPFQDYELGYRVLEHVTEIQFPHLSALTLTVGYRNQKREGHRQAYTTSHCDTCHITSQSHPVNETTEDLQLEAQVVFNGGSVRAGVTSRELNQGFSALSLLYDDALHPELRKPVFDNRLQFDSAEGPQMVDLWPDIDKDTSRLDLHLNNVGGFVVNGGAVWSKTENRFTGLQSEYGGYMVNAARRIGSKWRLAWSGRVYSIDNDDVFVDTNERVTPVGTHAGKTYEDIYGKNFDYIRYSALNRDALESRLDLSYRLGSTEAGTLKFEWDLTAVDRDNYQVLVNETETTTNVLGVRWRARPAKSLRLDARYRHAEIDNPFMLVDGACSTLESPRYTNPWSPETPQYDSFQDARIAETTASPSSWDELRLAATANLGASASLTGVYRWWNGDNSDGDLTNWSKTSQSATLTFWSAPAQSWDWYLGYTWMDSQLDAPACIPIFDG